MEELIRIGSATDIKRYGWSDPWKSPFSPDSHLEWEEIADKTYIIFWKKGNDK